MDRYGRFIVKHRILVVAVFGFLLIPSLFGMAFTRKNYDILSYMPGDLNSRQGEEILQEKFNVSGIGLVMTRNMEHQEILEIKSDIEDVAGVDKVLWIDDFEDISIPMEFMQPEVREMFLHGDSALLQVYFRENSRAESTMEAVKMIRNIIGDGTLFGGEPAIMYDMQETTSREMLYYIIIGFTTIFLILSASMTSFIEPLLFLVSVGVAVVLNLGTNVIKGEISFVTASIAAVMQLGISMDYSIFLLHRYEEEKKKYPDVKDAMVSAISKTFISVLSSALTTIAGFIALMAMKNGIGSDLGFVLAKGILLSLVVTMSVLPCLILIFGKYADKHRHKPLIPSFEKSSRWLVKLRWVFLAIIIIVAVPSFLAQRNLDYYYSTRYYLPESARSVKDTNEISSVLGVNEYAYVIIPDEGRSAERQVMDRILSIPAVDSVSGLSEQVDAGIPDTYIPDELKDTYVKDGYRYFQVMLSTPADDPETFRAIDTIRDMLGESFNEYYVTGSPALTRDLAGLVDKDMRNVSIVSISLILLIVAFSFMSLSIPVILVLVIQLAVWINLSIPYFQGTAVSSITSIVIGAIQLGATVDYAILFTSRYRENIGIIGNRLEAIRQTIADTGRSILTSALTMIAATLGIAFIASIKTTGELTLMIARGAAISMAMIFFGLPSLFMIFGKLIDRTTINRNSYTKGVESYEKKNI